jgi:4-oxalocrotonate tautomerase
MPYINVQVTKGVTREQKKQIVAQMTKTMVDVLGKNPEHTHIVIQEIATDNWGFAGELTTDYRKRESAKRKPQAR